MTHTLTLTHIMGMGFCGYGYGSAFSDPGLTHGDPYAPVACWDSIHSILCIAALNNLELHHINVKNAYLNAPLKEEIYMVAPKECGARYWQLQKGLYGLRQAGRQWYIHLHETYLSLGFSRCKSDWSMYTRWSATGISISATSVDDLLLVSNSKVESDLAAA